MTVSEWLKKPEIAKLKEEGITGRAMSESFFRDPLRSITFNRNLLYAPADGVILYAQEYNSDDFLNIKGRNFTLKDALCDEHYHYRSLVVGVFMTALSVHINRVPTDSFFVEERNTPNLFTNNSSMLDMEHAVLNEPEYNLDDMAYLISNERKVSVLYSTRLAQRYYIVQVADKDVDVIVNWGKGKWIEQGGRFGQIRWGSQTDLIIPLIKKHNYNILVKKLDYVEAGTDAVIELY